MVPPGTKLAPKPEAIKDWSTLTADEKKLFTRQMEIFAGFGEYADTEIGRLVDAIKDMGQLDNTLVFYILGDNGTSAEGGMDGMFNEMTYFNGVAGNRRGHPEALRRARAGRCRIRTWPPAGRWRRHAVHVDEAGGVELRRHAERMIVSLAEARHGEGRGALAVPSRHRRRADRARSGGLPEPKSVNGTLQAPIEGVSMVYAFDEAKAESRHKIQYFEIFGNRAIYADGWFAGTIHKAPWEAKPRAALLDDKWELYDTRSDFSLANDLAAANPAKLKELQDLFLKEAVKYRVLPIDDRGIERPNAKLAGRPDLMGDRTSLTLHAGMTGMSENVFINMKNRSLTITADVEIPKGGANGVILAQGGRFGGWRLYLKDGKPIYDYNFLGLEHFRVARRRPFPRARRRFASTSPMTAAASARAAWEPSA